MSRPTVSVLMPVRNGAATIRLALRSMLRDLPDDAELLVHDDASDDDTADLLERVRDPRVVVERVEHGLGVADALNRLLDRSRGRFVARMDADDVVLPGRFRRSLRAVEAGADLVFANRVNFGPRLRHWRPAPLGAVDAPLLRLLLAVENPVPHGTLLADGDLLRGAERYRPGPAEDYDLWLRLVAGGARAVRLAPPAIAYRIHDGQVTRGEGWHRRFDLDPALRQAHAVHDAALGWTGAETWPALRDRAGDPALRRQYGAFLRAAGSALSPADRRRLGAALRRVGL